jgi:translation initiation factor 1
MGFDSDRKSAKDQRSAFRYTQIALRFFLRTAHGVMRKANQTITIMDLQDQLKNLFPDHRPADDHNSEPEQEELWMQEAPILCIYEKRKGKPVTILKGYTGADADFKKLAKELKGRLNVGGSFKDGTIIVQGDYRNKIMEILREKGFKVKRVGG